MQTSTLLSLVLLLNLLASPLPRQGGKSLRGGATLRAAHTRVRITVNVTSPDGAAVTGLSKNDFELYEDGARRDILSLDVQDQPLSIGILLDTSASQRKHLAATTDAIRAFIERSGNENEYFLIPFSTGQEFGAKPSDARTAANQLAAVRPGGKSPLYDAVAFGLEKIQHGRHARRALLLITDGQETASRIGYAEMWKKVKESGVPIYCLGVGNTNDSGPFETVDPRRGRRLLEDLASLSGGMVFLRDERPQLLKASGVIADAMRHPYRLDFYSAASKFDGRWHKLDVRLAQTNNRPKFHVTAKKGYYLSQ